MQNRIEAGKQKPFLLIVIQQGYDELCANDSDESLFTITTLYDNRVLHL